MSLFVNFKITWISTTAIAITITTINNNNYNLKADDYTKIYSFNWKIFLLLIISIKVLELVFERFLFTFLSFFFDLAQYTYTFMK